MKKKTLDLLEKRMMVYLKIGKDVKIGRRKHEYDNIINLALQLKTNFLFSLS